MVFEYDEEKNQANIKKHGISFKVAARVSFDYNRIELYDEANSYTEDRFDTIGSLDVGMRELSIGKIGDHTEDIIFVVYTERSRIQQNDQPIEVTRLISARMATSFGNRGKKNEFLSESLEADTTIHTTAFYRLFSQVLDENLQLTAEEDVFGEKTDYWYKKKE